MITLIFLALCILGWTDASLWWVILTLIIDSMIVAE